ncbi:hypothetical protein HGRIS_008282 [Hohenbuehelia grisea]|uniref:Elongation factor Ts, mitochondrial n=1 Tax=Hohenbuehelia grisea TaxID=104357 RepID=A0ABR3J7I0_9AGAR
MFRRVPAVLPRCYSTKPLPKPSLKLVAELRKLTDVSITKAREALSASANDVDLALEWLKRDYITDGAKKAAKVEGRVAREGLISVAVLSPGARGRGGPGSGGVRAAMVELNCETDFVGRNELFGKLAADIAHTAAFISEPVDSDALFRNCDLDVLLNAPLMCADDEAWDIPPRIGNAIRETITKVGEKVSLRRAAVVVHDPLQQKQPELALRVASYVHGAINRPSQGRIGSLALLALKSPNLSALLQSTTFMENLEKLERSLGRQIVGFDTQRIRSDSGEKDETALYDQPFMMLPGELSGQPVQEALRQWIIQNGTAGEGADTQALEVLDFAKWTVGGAIEEASS